MKKVTLAIILTIITFASIANATCERNGQLNRFYCQAEEEAVRILNGNKNENIAYIEDSKWRRKVTRFNLDSLSKQALRAAVKVLVKSERSSEVSPTTVNTDGEYIQYTIKKGPTIEYGTVKCAMMFGIKQANLTRETSTPEKFLGQSLCIVSNTSDENVYLLGRRFRKN